MKVFFDTNVYVAEALGGRASAAAIELSLAARWRVYSTPHVLTELRRVLQEERLVSTRLAAEACRRVQRGVTTVEQQPSRHVVPSDPADTPILRAAVTAGVDYLVTNDRHLLSLDPYESVRIVRLAAFLDLLKHLGPSQGA